MIALKSTLYHVKIMCDLSWLQGPFGHYPSSMKTSLQKNTFDFEMMNDHVEKMYTIVQEKVAQEKAKLSRINSGTQRATRKMAKKYGTAVVQSDALEKNLSEIRRVKSVRKKALENDVVCLVELLSKPIISSCKRNKVI
jgi:hypothetical protein